MGFQGRNARCQSGMTLLELLIVLAVLAVLAGVAIPCFQHLRERCTVAAATQELLSLVKEAIAGGALKFDTAATTVCLLGDPGSDGRWGTGDDVVLREVCLGRKFAPVTFGYGNRGPAPGLAAAADGVSFDNNLLVCSGSVTGSAGTIYLQAGNDRAAAATAVTVNSLAGIKTWSWNGSTWRQQ